MLGVLSLVKGGAKRRLDIRLNRRRLHDRHGHLVLDQIFMTLTARKVARHILIMIVLLVALTALAIWLGLGPVVHSSASLGSHSN
jgi:hypothetical protein